MFFRRLTSSTTGWDFSRESQKSGRAMVAWRRSSRWRLPATSKIPPQVLHALGGGGDSALQFLSGHECVWVEGQGTGNDKGGGRREGGGPPPCPPSPGKEGRGDSPALGYFSVLSTPMTTSLLSSRDSTMRLEGTTRSFFTAISSPLRARNSSISLR